VAERLNVTLHFPAVDWLVLGDGAGWLYLLATGDRTRTDHWQVWTVVAFTLHVSWLIVLFSAGLLLGVSKCYNTCKSSILIHIKLS